MVRQKPEKSQGRRGRPPGDDEELRDPQKLIRRRSSVSRLTVVFFLFAASVFPQLLNDAARSGCCAGWIPNGRDTRSFRARFGNLRRSGYTETKSSALLAAELQNAGFRVEKGVANMPTAFVATYGQGKPVIAILGEYDALPGLSQDTVPEKKPIVPGGNGHGCGHNTFGVAAAHGAIAAKRLMEERKLAGTIRFYGTPAEEGGGGKIHMIRARAVQRCRRGDHVASVGREWCSEPGVARKCQRALQIHRAGCARGGGSDRAGRHSMRP